MESKIKTHAGNTYEVWQNFDKQKGIQFCEVINKNSGKHDRKWRFRFRFRKKLYTEVIGFENKEKWTEFKVIKLWEEYAANRTLGNEPFSPGGKVQIIEKEKEMAVQAAAKERAITIRGLFNEAMQLRDVNTSATHRSHYRQIFKDWIEPILGNLPVKELKAVHIAQVLKCMQDGIIPRTMPEHERKRYKTTPRSSQSQEHAWNVIRIVWTYACDNNLAAGKYPGAKIKPKVNNERMRYLTEEEAGKVLADLCGSGQIASGGHGSGGRKGSLDAWGKALLSLHCGLRAGEILSLTWRNVSLNDRIGIIYDTKNKGQHRKFYLTPNVVEMLEQRMAFSKYTKPGDFVFPGKDGKQVGEMGDVFTRCFKRLGLNKGDELSQDKVVFHTFRHSFATWLAQRGTPMSVIAELMGHSITKTTERYIQYAPKTVIKDAISFFTTMNHVAAIEEKGVIDV